jgi:methylated-DNA-protein-cysteine methyltransferase-like protein
MCKPPVGLGANLTLTRFSIGRKDSLFLKNKVLGNRDSKMEKDFFQQVYQVVRLIPKGRVTSYGAIAAYLGSASSARIVGYAMNAAHQVKPKVPAHRVVNRNGLLSGKHHFETPFTMQELLQKENIKVKDDQIIDFKLHFWDPTKELNI